MKHSDLLSLNSTFSLDSNINDTLVRAGQRRLLSVETDFPASVDIASLTPATGFSINGVRQGDGVGYSVSSAGDINHDGIDDVIIGAPNVNSLAGACYVIFGKPGIGSLNSIMPSNLNGKNGFVLTGVAGNSYSESGSSVSGVGDINGDGIDDLIIGAPYTNSDTGASYVVFGKADIGSSGSIALSSLNGANGFVVTGINGGNSCPPCDYSGTSVSGVGDINSDGVNDFIIGAPGANFNAGASYVVFGGVAIGSSGNIALSSLNGTNGFVLNGINGGFGSGDASGTSVSGADDVNGDGVSDLIIGAPGYNSQTSASYVVFGKPDIGKSGNIALSSLNGSNGFVIKSDADYAQFGASVSGAGDVNGDELADLIIGAPYVNSGAGAGYIIFGNPDIGNSGNITLSSLNSSNGFILNGVLSRGSVGASVSGAGDVNDDGVDDLIIGAPSMGCSFIIFGNSNVDSFSNMTLFCLNGISLNGVNGFIFYGFGDSVSSAGDVNADGVDDLVIGSTQTASGGAGYIIFGDAIISLLNNQLTIPKGNTVLLNSSDLNATYLTHFSWNSNILFTVSGIEHGYFSFVNNSFIAITNFLQQHINHGEVQFTHDDSAFPPSYNIQIGQGLIALTQPAAITFIHRGATLVNNKFFVNQGQTLTLFSSQLNAKDLDNSNDDPSLIFLASSVQHGYFQQAGNPGVAITGFVQSQVEVGAIQFVHDGSLSAPSCNIGVSDGSITTTPQPCNITFNLAPILGNNTMTLNQRQSLVLNNTMFSAMDPDNSASDLTFIVSNVRHGQFELMNRPGDPITSFTQSQISNGTVQFVQDGTVYAPGDWVAVSDGKMTIPAQATQIFFNAAPVLINNQLTVKQGQTVVLNSNDFSATDPDDSAPGLTFVVSDVTQGRFEFLDSPGNPLFHFTQAQLQNGSIQFVQNNSIYAPGISMAVSDGKMIIPAQATHITFDASPVLTTNQLVLGQGQTVLMSAINLAATDPDNSAPSLIFLISAVQHGYFQRNSDLGAAIMQFAQGEVQNSVIQFVADGSTSIPGYQVSVSDGIMTTTPQSSAVTFYVAPTLVNNNLSVNQGQSVIFTTDNLSAVDPNFGADSLTFIIGEVQYGHFELINNRGVLIASFTQRQIENNQVQFITDGSSNAPVYSIALTNGKVTTPAQLSVVSFHIAPVLVSNSLSITQGQTIILTLAQLSATQAGNYVGSLTFIISGVTGGRFALVGAANIAITQFTQTQIQKGEVEFTQDDTATVPGYSVTVSDGQISTSLQPAEITFEAMPVLEKNILTVTQGQTLILTSDQLSATDRETPSGELVFTASAVQHGHFEDIGASGIATMQFSQQRIAGGAIKFITDGSSDSPAYNVSVSDGLLFTLPSAAIVNFSPRTGITEQSTSTIVRNAIMGAVISGVMGFGFFVVQLCIRRRAEKYFEQATIDAEGAGKEQADFHKNVIRPVTKRVLERVKIAGITGYVSQNTARDTVSAIIAIIHQLERQGVNMDLNKLKAVDQTHLVDLIARKTRHVLVPDVSCCSVTRLARFFCAETTPQKMEEKAAEIAAKVKAGWVGPTSRRQDDQKVLNILTLEQKMSLELKSFTPDIVLENESADQAMMVSPSQPINAQRHMSSSQDFDAESGSPARTGVFSSLEKRPLNTIVSSTVDKGFS